MVVLVVEYLAIMVDVMKKTLPMLELALLDMVAPKIEVAHISIKQQVVVVVLHLEYLALGLVEIILALMAATMVVASAIVPPAVAQVI